MKIVINVCFGGFSISPRAMKRMAELKGRPCYFFRQEGFQGPYIPCEMPEEKGRSAIMSVSAFDVPNPNEVLAKYDAASWHAMSLDERKASNELHSAHSISSRPDDRTDPDLIQVVEELGEAANGACAELKVVEVPDGIEWEIDEYDGTETIDEKHRSWA